METVLLIKFIKHLIECTDVVLEKDEIEQLDVVGLRRELDQLKRNIDGKETVDPVLLEKILGLEVHCDERLLGDTKKGRWLLVMSLVLRRSPIIAFERERRREEAQRQISRFKEELDHIRFSLEFLLT